MGRTVEESESLPDLSQFDEAWGKTANATEEIYSDIPDGAYEAVIEELRVAETPSGRPMLIWVLRIEGPEAIGRAITKTWTVTEKTLPYIRQDLERCGLVLRRFSELPARAHELVDHPVRIEKRTKERRAEVYFRYSKPKTPVADDLGDDLPF